MVLHLKTLCSRWQAHTLYHLHGSLYDLPPGPSCPTSKPKHVLCAVHQSIVFFKLTMYCVHLKFRFPVPVCFCSSTRATSALSASKRTFQLSAQESTALCCTTLPTTIQSLRYDHFSFVFATTSHSLIREATPFLLLMFMWHDEIEVFDRSSSHDGVSRFRCSPSIAV